MPELVDVPGAREVLSTTVVHDGMIWDVVRDRIDLGEGGVVDREYVRHPGAVAVVALDDEDRVLLLSQYRHPVRHELWEPPAGLLDVPGEDHQVAAARELAEEADLVADSWWHLVEFFTSPGGSDEGVDIFLARGVRAVPEGERHTREAEEHGMVPRWVPLDEAVAAVLAGRVHNPSAVIGILAAHAGRSRGWADLRAVTPVS
ncbi:MAG TPA: NUDIX hydrolase [Actinotalea sp.]|jgi:ADP-ribose pyrophosphatase